MNFLVYEPDPLVLFDIGETILSAFADVNVALADSPARLHELAEQMSLPFVAIISVTTDDIARVLKVVKDVEDSVRVVVISNTDAATATSAGAFAHLQRPFSSDTLLRAVNHACSDLPADRS